MASLHGPDGLAQSPTTTLVATCSAFLTFSCIFSPRSGARDQTLQAVLSNLCISSRSILWNVETITVSPHECEREGETPFFFKIRWINQNLYFIEREKNHGFYFSMKGTRLQTLKKWE